MRRRLPALLLLPLLLQGCQRAQVVVSEPQRAACRRDAEKAPTPEEALDLKATCLKEALQAHGQPPEPPPPPRPPTQASASPPASIDRYLYCRVHQEEVQAASARLTNAAKPWILAPKRYSPQSEEYLAVRREYESAVAELERLLPPEIRNGMDLLPTATRAFSRCDREELEQTAGASAA